MKRFSYQAFRNMASTGVLPQPKNSDEYNLIPECFNDMEDLMNRVKQFSSFSQFYMSYGDKEISNQIKTYLSSRPEFEMKRRPRVRDNVNDAPILDIDAIVVSLMKSIQEVRESIDYASKSIKTIKHTLATMNTMKRNAVKQELCRRVENEQVDVIQCEDQSDLMNQLSELHECTACEHYEASVCGADKCDGPDCSSD